MKLILYLQIGLFSLLSIQSKGQVNNKSANSIEEKDAYVFKPDQKTVNYIYNRAIDIIARHSKVFKSYLHIEEKPLFNIANNKIIVNTKLDNIPTYSPNLFDIICSDQQNFKILNCQAYFNKVVFSNSFPIVKSYSKEWYEIDKLIDDKSGNVVVSFTNLSQFKNLVFLKANICWNTYKNEEDQSRGFSNLVLEMEICEGKYILFRKLFTDIMGVALVNGATLQKEKDRVYNDDDISYYEFDMQDKSCGE